MSFNSLFELFRLSLESHVGTSADGLKYQIKGFQGLLEDPSFEPPHVAVLRTAWPIIEIFQAGQAGAADFEAARSLAAQLREIEEVAAC